MQVSLKENSFYAIQYRGNLNQVIHEIAQHSAAFSKIDTRHCGAILEISTNQNKLTLGVGGWVVIDSLGNIAAYSDEDFKILFS